MLRGTNNWSNQENVRQCMAARWQITVQDVQEYIAFQVLNGKNDFLQTAMIQSNMWLYKVSLGKKQQHLIVNILLLLH